MYKSINSKRSWLVLFSMLNLFVFTEGKADDEASPNCNRLPDPPQTVLKALFSAYQISGPLVESLTAYHGTAAKCFHASEKETYSVSVGPTTGGNGVLIVKCYNSPNKTCGSGNLTCSITDGNSADKSYACKMGQDMLAVVINNEGIMTADIHKFTEHGPGLV